MLTRITILGTIVALALVTACGGPRTVRSQLAQQGRRDLDCRGHVEVLQLTDTAFQVSGCGEMREYATTGQSDITPAAALAARDLQCPIDQLVLAGNRSTTERGFVGCGRTTAYTLVCNTGGCSWVNRPPPPQPSTPPQTLPVSTEPGLDSVALPPAPGSESLGSPVTP